MVRRRVAAGVGVALLIVIVLVVNGCLKSQAQEALKEYNQSVTQIAQESDQQVSHPFFAALAGASGRSASEVEQQLNQLRMTAQTLASRAKGLSVPGAMQGAQRNLLLAFDLREEGVTKIGGLVSTALGGQSKRASTLIAGDMEIFLGSDVIYSQRVAPLIRQALAANNIHEQVASSQFLPNLGWLTPSTVLARLTGGSSASGPVAPGTHGHSLTGVSVGSNTLEQSPTLNHIHGGANPTFTIALQNTGSNPETGVKVEVSVTSEGRQLKSSHTINKTEPGQTVSVDIPVEGVTLGVASKITVYIQPVPGETNVENNKGTYLAVFEQ